MILGSCAGVRLAVAGRVCEFENLDRCAAYVATRGALESVHRAVYGWPPELAEQARRAAIATVMTTAECIAYDHASAGRRRCLRTAIGTAIELAATCDIAFALGLGDSELDRTLRLAGRSIALLGMFFHANAHPCPEAVMD